jgi:hypothetical protein
MVGQLLLELGDTDGAIAALHDAGEHFERVDQLRAAYRCQVQALELENVLPAALLAALEAADADAGCRVEAARLHLASPRTDVPPRHWESIVTTAAAAAAAREHRWTDRAAS